MVWQILSTSTLLCNNSCSLVAIKSSKLSTLVTLTLKGVTTKDNEIGSFEITEWLYCPLYFTFMLASENSQHFMRPQYWFPCEMMAASLPRWTWYTSHFANKTIGSLAKCWLFSQAIFMLSKVLSYYERHNVYCCLTSSWFLEPWLPSSVLLTLLPVFSSAGAGIWCTQLLQGRTTAVNIQSQRTKIRKSWLIAQGWWIMLSGLWILFLTCPSGKGSF